MTAATADQQFAGQVRSMFDRIAGVYDLMNTAMTAGLHHGWRERAAERAGLEPGSVALDVCCGTGDLALALGARVGRHGRVIGFNNLLNGGMSAMWAREQAFERAARLGFAGMPRS